MNLHRVTPNLRELTEEQIMDYLRATKPAKGLASTRQVQERRTQAIDELVRRDIVRAHAK